MHELEVQITDELALAESSRPEDPVVESDAGRRPNPTVKAYETRLLTVRGTVEAVEGDGTARAEVMAESVTVVNLESHKARESSSALMRWASTHTDQSSRRKAVSRLPILDRTPS